jgi:hypothetical protein
MVESRKTFGRAAPRSAAPSDAARPDAGDALADDPKAATYDWVTQPIREGLREDALHDADLSARLVHLFTKSPYRHWLWITCGIVAFIVFQFGLLGGGIVMPERSGQDYVGGNAPREAAQIVDFALDADGFHEDSDLMAENLAMTGTLLNLTEETIWQVTLKAYVHDCTGGLEFEECPEAWSGVLTFGVEVPPGESVELAETIPAGGLPRLEGEPYARYEMLAVSTR